MKVLNKMLAAAAVMSAMNFAKAEGVEKVFEPTNGNDAVIDRIELVNGQILVRAPEAEIQGEKTPYVYVGTNTNHFAENAFAQGGLTNVAQYVHMGNGKIYMTENGNTKDVWTTTVSDKPALNGVTGGVKKESGLEGSADESLLKVMKESIEAGYVTKMFNGELYRAEDGTGIKKYTGSEWTAKNTINVNGGHIKDFDVAPNGRTDVTIYSIVEDSNKRTYLYRNSTEKAVLGEGSDTTNSYSGLPSNVKSVVRANGIIYYATDKKLGYVRE
ncbi:MAG: hypothetical protein SPL08_04190 [Pseudomonadota bacterium]|nr:hypothetical protein [Pseudomonadota bacterium]